MSDTSSTDILNQIRAELSKLEDDSINIDGVSLKPSQCYHLETDPAHVLFNTNCPESLKEKVMAILDKYSQRNEARS
jgi:hypothetical protein